MDCSATADCHGWHAFCKDGLCVAYSLWKLPVADLLMGVLSFIIAGISLAAGVGGGGMFVPLLMMLLSFDARVATALSQSMLLGGAVAAFMYNLDHSHPHVPGRALVDFQLACLMGPTLMSGATIGYVIHAVSPSAVLLFLLCVVLLDAARKGLQNAWKIQAKEKEAAAAGHVPSHHAHAHHAPGHHAPGHHAPDHHAPDHHAPDRAAKLVEGDESSSESEPESRSSTSLAEDNAEVAVRMSDAKCKLFFVWLICVAEVLSRRYLVTLCSPGWWCIVIGATVCLGAFGAWYANELHSQSPVDEECLDFRELAFPLVRWSFVAGVLSALCGIGGGMVMGPILVGLKVPPPVSSATTATTLLVLSSSTALVYICRDIAPRDYSVYLSLLTTIGALVGKVLIGRWVKQTGRESVLVWALAGITIVSTVLMGSLGLVRVVELGSEAFAFGNLCVDPDEKS